ncbi:MAG: D-alanyl-D-alanine carboxypeptidase [Acidobacteria bacterium]|nr:D-alanyl-D-alanine carboxypeptidase [Acidobacteriota bacterium]MBV9476778.1 D-alanyl-D-alanine carboxypeptidase [Acidobacteriota bacterium]
MTSCATTTTSPLRQAIDSEIAKFPRALWFADVEDDNGHVLYARNASLLAVPASNRKLAAAVTIANCLGTDTRLATTIWRDGDDLVVSGDGDPSLGSWRYERDNDFDVVANALRARGITRVRDLVADVSSFGDRITIPPAWKVNYLPETYGAPVDAIAWEENGANGHSIPDPGMFALAALRDALVLHGIAVDGTLRVNTTAHALNEQMGEKLLEIPSPFVGQLLTTVLKNSQNLYTEMLFKRASDGTYASSFARERALLASDIGARGDAFRFVDGCGLAPDDLVAAETTVKILRWMNDPARRGFWWTVLAQPGEEGTLHRRVVALHDRMRGKTGTLNGVNALSGIIAMPDGHYRYFSLMVNHQASDADAEDALDAMALAIAR